MQGGRLQCQNGWGAYFNIKMDDPIQLQVRQSGCHIQRYLVAPAANFAT